MGWEGQCYSLWRPEHCDMREIWFGRGVKEQVHVLYV